MMFGMAALRRGPHWQLQVVPAEATPFGERIDEAELLSEAIAGVMKHVPLPTRELGIVSDLTTAAIAFYSVLGPRMAMDKYVAEQRAIAARQGRGAFVAPEHGAAVTPDAAATMEGIAGDGAPIRATVESQPAPDRILTGDPVADGIQLGHAPTAGLGTLDDPEPVLFAAFRPGETPARVEDLAEPGGEPLLDRIAPVIEVDGEPAARELDAGA